MRLRKEVHTVSWNGADGAAKKEQLLSLLNDHKLLLWVCPVHAAFKAEFCDMETLADIDRRQKAEAQLKETAETPPKTNGKQPDPEIARERDAGDAALTASAARAEREEATHNSQGQLLARRKGGEKKERKRKRGDNAGDGGPASSKKPKPAEAAEPAKPAAPAAPSVPMQSLSYRDQINHLAALETPATAPSSRAARHRIQPRSAVQDAEDAAKTAVLEKKNAENTAIEKAIVAARKATLDAHARAGSATKPAQPAIEVDERLLWIDEWFWRYGFFQPCNKMAPVNCYGGPSMGLPALHADDYCIGIRDPNNGTTIFCLHHHNKHKDKAWSEWSTTKDGLQDSSFFNRSRTCAMHLVNARWVWNVIPEALRKYGADPTSRKRMAEIQLESLKLSIRDLAQQETFVPSRTSDKKSDLYRVPWLCHLCERDRCAADFSDFKDDDKAVDLMTCFFASDDAFYNKVEAEEKPNRPWIQLHKKLVGTILRRLRKTLRECRQPTLDTILDAVLEPFDDVRLRPVEALAAVLAFKGSQRLSVRFMREMDNVKITPESVADIIADATKLKASSTVSELACCEDWEQRIACPGHDHSESEFCKHCGTKNDGLRHAFRPTAFFKPAPAAVAAAAAIASSIPEDGDEDEGLRSPNLYQSDGPVRRQQPLTTTVLAQTEMSEAAAKELGILTIKPVNILEDDERPLVISDFGSLPIPTRKPDRPVIVLAKKYTSMWSKIPDIHGDAEKRTKELRALYAAIDDDMRNPRHLPAARELLKYCLRLFGRLEPSVSMEPFLTAKAGNEEEQFWAVVNRDGVLTYSGARLYKACRHWTWYLLCRWRVVASSNLREAHLCWLFARNLHGPIELEEESKFRVPFNGDAIKYFDSTSVGETEVMDMESTVSDGVLDELVPRGAPVCMLALVGLMTQGLFKQQFSDLFPELRETRIWPMPASETLTDEDTHLDLNDRACAVQVAAIFAAERVKFMVKAFATAPGSIFVTDGRKGRRAVLLGGAQDYGLGIDHQLEPFKETRLKAPVLGLQDVLYGIPKATRAEEATRDWPILLEKLLCRLAILWARSTDGKKWLREHLTEPCREIRQGKRDESELPTAAERDAQIAASKVRTDRLVGLTSQSGRRIFRIIATIDSAVRHILTGAAWCIQWALGRLAPVWRTWHSTGGDDVHESPFSQLVKEQYVRVLIATDEAREQFEKADKSFRQLLVGRVEPLKPPIRAFDLTMKFFEEIEVDGLPRSTYKVHGLGAIGYKPRLDDVVKSFACLFISQSRLTRMETFLRTFGWWINSRLLVNWETAANRAIVRREGKPVSLDDLRELTVPLLEPTSAELPRAHLYFPGKFVSTKKNRCKTNLLSRILTESFPGDATWDGLIFDALMELGPASTKGVLSLPVVSDLGTDGNLHPLKKVGAIPGLKDDLLVPTKREQRKHPLKWPIRLTRSRVMASLLNCHLYDRDDPIWPPDPAPLSKVAYYTWPLQEGQITGRDRDEKFIHRMVRSVFASDGVTGVYLGPPKKFYRDWTAKKQGRFCVEFLPEVHFWMKWLFWFVLVPDSARRPGVLPMLPGFLLRLQFDTKKTKDPRESLYFAFTADCVKEACRIFTGSDEEGDKLYHIANDNMATEVFSKGEGLWDERLVNGTNVWKVEEEEEEEKKATKPAVDQRAIFERLAAARAAQPPPPPIRPPTAEAIAVVDDILETMRREPKDPDEEI